MGLNTKQKLAMTAVIGGLITVPVVYAKRNSTPASENPEAIKALKDNSNRNLNPPFNGIVFTETGKSASLPPQPTITYQPQTARNNLQRNDVLTKDSTKQYTGANNSDNFNGNNATTSTMPVSGVKDCQYSPDAIKAGVKHYRFADANPTDLVDVGGGRKLHREAANALRELQAAARADGVTLTFGSAWRDSTYQRGIVARKKAAGQSDAQIYKVSSASGYSEHHTGYALDFSPINNGFASSKAYAWLRQHGNEHGWYQSFTPQSTRDTHVAVESWHWKYKGTPNAIAALANDACY